MCDGKTVLCNNIMFIIFFRFLAFLFCFSFEYVYLIALLSRMVGYCFIFLNTISLITLYIHIYGSVAHTGGGLGVNPSPFGTQKTT